MMKIRLLYIIVIAFSAALINTCSGVNDDLTNLLSSGDWVRIKDAVCRWEEPFGSDRSIVAGYAGLATGDYRLAMEGFSQATDRANDQPDSYFIKKAEFTSAKESEKWIFWLLRADTLVRLGQYEQAIESLSKAIELNPRAAIAHHLRGTIRLLAGDDYSALQDIERAIKSDPALADAYLVRGIVLLRQGQPVEAQKEFEQALRIAPDFAVAANARGVTLCKQRRYDEALQAFALSQDLAPNFDAAQRNMELTWELASGNRTRTRLGILTGRRKGVIGCRLIAPVITSSDDRDSAVAATAMAVEMATGENPGITEDAAEACRTALSDRPVVVPITLSEIEKKPYYISEVLETIASSDSQVDVRIIANGPTASIETVSALSEYYQGSTKDKATVESCILVDFSDKREELASLKAIAQKTLALRAKGLHIQAFLPVDSAAMGEWNALSPSDKAALPVFSVPAVRHIGLLGQSGHLIEFLPVPISSSWVGHQPQTNPPISTATLLCSTNGYTGFYLPDLTHPDFGSSGPRAPAIDGISIGTSRTDRNPQILIDDKILIRFDIVKSHGRKGHINIQIGQKNIHTDVDGKKVEITGNEEITVIVGHGKIQIYADGKKSDEYEIQEANNQEDIVITWAPGGTVTVTKGGKPIGKSETKEDGTVVIEVDGKRIEIPPVSSGKSEDGKTGKTDDNESDGKNDKGVRVGGDKSGKSNGDKKADMNAYSPPEELKPPPEPLPPGWILVPGPCGPIAMPKPKGYVTSSYEADERGGVYTVDDTNLQVLSVGDGDTRLLYGAYQNTPRVTADMLQCPLLILQKSVLEELKR